MTERIDTAVVMGWMRLVVTADGPKRYTDRLILLALATLMLKANECPLRVTHAELCGATTLSRNWIIYGIKRLEADGWITRARVAGLGRGWAGYIYTPSFPDGNRHPNAPRYLGRGALANPRCKCGRARVVEQSWCTTCRNAYQRQWRKHHPLEGEALVKANARSYANTYQRRGKLRQERCWECGDERAEKHHDDYSKPLQVAWMCRKCHLVAHETGVFPVKPFSADGADQGATEARV